ncbi:MAG: LysR family transcriptional regulator [Gammaproteobacteria bacterium]|nr:LysR family transcriptional regulator [Gammaproteobacteria bacterium]MYG68360.1 LysR family transcriptional regulator [Gammaproteobacteria bacterium]MYH90744.1 LysR family transcriptional regulator [Gammaproteobacteria bacterium]
MKELREIAVSGQHLLVFEVAARHVSFAAAARELELTQPAVSRSVRKLEQALGVALFIRRHRAIDLTEAGGVLYEAVHGGFSQMYQVARRLRRITHAHVSLLCSDTHAHWWLMPRLSDFQGKYPGISLRVEVIKRYVDLEPAGPEGMVLGIWSGEQPRPGYECVEIAPEEVFPVANPALARTLDIGDDLAALAGQRLIHEDQKELPTLTWREYFAAYGLLREDEELPGLRLSDYSPVLAATLAGQGIALGLAHIVNPLIESGLLVRIGTRVHRTSLRFYLVWPERTALTPQAEQVKDWLIGTLSRTNR